MKTVFKEFSPDIIFSRVKCANILYFPNFKVYHWNYINLFVEYKANILHKNQISKEVILFKAFRLKKY